LPVCNAEAMQLHLDDIAAKVAPRAHAMHEQRNGIEAGASLLAKLDLTI
jgi:hypothetical protein